MDKGGGIERRQHPRLPIILQVTYPGRGELRDFTENLSAGGLFIRTERGLKVGERVALSVSFGPLLDPEQIEVEVVRVRPSTATEGAGVAVRVVDEAGKQHVARLSRAALEASPAPLRTYRILIAEDNVLLARMYTDTLTHGPRDLSSQIQVETVADGETAFQRLKALPRVDLLIADRHMPVLSGFALIRRLRADALLKDLPVVMVSAADPAAEADARALGVRVYLRKPVKYAEIVKTVEALLRAR